MHEILVLGIIFVNIAPMITEIDSSIVLTYVNHKEETTCGQRHTFLVTLRLWCQFLFFSTFIKRNDES